MEIDIFLVFPKELEIQVINIFEHFFLFTLKIF